MSPVLSIVDPRNIFWLTLYVRALWSRVKPDQLYQGQVCRSIDLLTASVTADVRHRMRQLSSPSSIDPFHHSRKLLFLAVWSLAALDFIIKLRVLLRPRQSSKVLRCPCPLAYLRNRVSLLHQIFGACYRGSVLHRRRWNTLCRPTSNFVDGVIFAIFTGLL